MDKCFDMKWRAGVLAGDRQAARQLAERMLTPIFRFCLYRVGMDQHLAEDATHDTLVRAIETIESYEPARSGGDIFPWLAGLARNEIRRLTAARSNAASLEAVWMAVDRDLLKIYAGLDGSPLTDDVVQRDETRCMVNAAMSQLPPQYERVLEGKYMSGKSVDQLAAEMKMTVSAAASLLSRARNAFRDAFVSLAKNLESGAILTK